jgi:hypothetical protein
MVRVLGSSSKIDILDDNMQYRVTDVLHGVPEGAIYFMKKALRN